MKKNLLPMLASILALSFLGFVDNKFRGWDDTNQYQLVAKNWAKGIRPPIKEIEANTEGVGSDYSKRTPILTPFVWSLLVKKNADWSESLWRIKVLQAILIAASYLLTFNYLGRGFSALFFASLFFLNRFFRDVVAMPITEPQSLFFIILPFVVPAAAGVCMVLQGLTRSPVLPLNVPKVIYNPRALRQVGLAVLSAAIIILYFGDLVRGVQVPIRPFSNAISAVRELADTSAQLLFNHLLPYQNKTFLVAWTGVIILFLCWLLLKSFKKKWLFLSLVGYFSLLFSVIPQGYRYFLPAFLLCLLEFRPKVPNKKWIHLLCIVFLCHLIFQQFEEVKLFRKYDQPDSQSTGLLQVKEWVRKENVNNLMMLKVRYCINFFDVQCFAFPHEMNKEGLAREIKSKKVNYIVFSGTNWMAEEPVIEKQLAQLFQDKKLEITKYERMFDRVKVVDVRAVPL